MQRTIARDDMNGKLVLEAMLYTECKTNSMARQASIHFVWYQFAIVSRAKTIHFTVFAGVECVFVFVFVSVAKTL